MANKVYTNSSLVVYTLLSPNCNKGRVHKTFNPDGVIDKITIHHMAGNCTIESCGEMFADASRRASSTYGIGTDGRIGQYCDEGDRPWTSSSAANDYRAVTIEVANDSKGPQWHISDKAFAALIELCADICKRNNFRLTYDGTKNGSLTRHDMFAATTCPGPYLGSRFPEIVELVNARLDGTSNKIELNTTLYKVQVGAYSIKENATKQLEKIEADGFDAFIVKVDNLYKVQVGAYSKKANAENQLAAVEAKGYDAFIQVEYSEKASDNNKVESNTSTENKTETKPETKPATKPATNTATKPATPAKSTIGEKDTVRVKSGAKDYTGHKLASFVYTRDHIVSELKGNRAVITYKGETVAAVHVNNLTLVKSASKTSTSTKPTNTATSNTTKKVTEGCKVKVKKGAKDYNGGKLYDFVYDRVHVVSELKGTRAVITYKGDIVAAVHTNNLIVQ